MPQRPMTRARRDARKKQNGTEQLYSTRSIKNVVNDVLQKMKPETRMRISDDAAAVIAQAVEQEALCLFRATLASMNEIVPCDQGEVRIMKPWYMRATIKVMSFRSRDKIY